MHFRNFWANVMSVVARYVGVNRASDLWRIATAAMAVAVTLDFAEHGRMKLLHGSLTLWWARGPVFVVAYWMIYALAVAAIVSVVLSESLKVRIAGYAIILSTALMQIGSRLIIAEDVSMHSIQLMWADRDVAAGTLTAFRTQAIYSALIALLATGVVASIAWFTPCRLPRRNLVSVPIAACAVGFFAYRMLDTTYLAMPAAMRVPINAAMAAWQHRYDGPRAEPDIIPRNDTAQPKVILLVVDESIRADSLGINGRQPDTTPFLGAWTGLLNLGTACAPSNVSSTSNYVIRNGITASELPDVEQVGLKRPSVFSFAKAAGYRTIMLDAQGVPGRLLNYMNRRDLDEIDEFWSPREDFPVSRPWEWDRILLRRLADCLTRKEKSFIWVNKVGAHFPYQDVVPPDRLAAAGQTLEPGESLTAAREDAVWNTYLSAVRFAVDDFFHELAQTASLDDVELLYIGDHGQSILEGDYPTTHGVVVDPPTTQVEVPLFIRGPVMNRRMFGRVEGARERCSAFALFPSLLELMGYSPTDVRPRFGQPLWGELTAERLYFTGDCFGLGRHFMYRYPSPPESSADTE